MTPRRSKSKHHRSHPDAATLLNRVRIPEFDTLFIDEAQLSFGGRHRLADPRTGLALYGPFDKDDARRTQIRLGIIGTGETIDLSQHWADQCRRKVVPIRRRKVKGKWELQPMDPTVFTAFPGMKEVFGCEFVVPPGLISTLRDADVDEIGRIPLFEPRVTRLVELLVEKIQVLSDKPSPPDVVICALPTRIRDLCTTPSKHKQKPKTRTLDRRVRASLDRDRQQGQENLFGADILAGADVVKDEEREHSVLHHGFKAQAMKVGLPTQLVWQNTLEGKGVQDDASRAWNFWTGIYYKAGNVPWKIEGLQSGTCYVGIAFYIDKRNSSYRTCMAQAFSDSGQGFVLRSDPFLWDENLGSPHLTREVARDLITLVLDEYERHLDHPPSRVVIHKKSRFWDTEREGFALGLKQRVRSHDLVAFGERGIRFFRTGEHPPLRNTMITFGKGNVLLYTLGYVPFVGEYSGMRVPRPLEIVEHFGSSSVRLIVEEILALTKMDYNSTAFSGRGPITIAFSEDVGHILAELPPGIDPRTQYRFYM